MSPVSRQSVSVHWDDPKANQSLQSICFPLKVDLLQGRARLCTFEIRQGYLRDHTNFSLVLPLEKFPRGGNCVISVSAGVYFSLCPISFCPPAEQRRSSGLPNGRWPVCFGTNSPGHHGCLHIYCGSSYTSQVSAITKLCSFNLYFIRTYQGFFQARTAGKSEHKEWDILKILRNVYFTW